MPERIGDIPIEERLYSGESDISEFFPTQNGEISMDVAFRKSHLRSESYFGVTRRATHAATRRDSYDKGVLLPPYVITQLIEIEGYRWSYSTPYNNAEDRRRVFIEEDQLIKLDVDESLIWLSAGKGSERYESTKRLLEEEASDTNVHNQIILQLMYGRIENGQALLPRTNNILRRDSRDG